MVKRRAKEQPQQPPAPPPQPQAPQPPPAEAPPQAWADWYFRLISEAVDASRLQQTLAYLTAMAEMADPSLRQKLDVLIALLSAPAALYVRTLAVFDMAATPEAIASKAATTYLQLLQTAYSVLVASKLDRLKAEADPVAQLRIIDEALTSMDSITQSSAIIEAIARGIAFLSAPRPMGGWAGVGQTAIQAERRKER
jgi:hypothetical protein